MVEVRDHALAPEAGDQGLLVCKVVARDDLGGGLRRVDAHLHKLVNRVLASSWRGIAGGIEPVEGVGAGLEAHDVNDAGIARRTEDRVRVRPLFHVDRTRGCALDRNHERGGGSAYASRDIAGALGVVAVIVALTPVKAGLPAVVAGLEDDVDHAADGVGAINRGRPVGEKLDVIDGGRGDHIHVDELVAERGLGRIEGNTPPVDEHERAQVVHRDRGTPHAEEGDVAGVFEPKIRIARELGHRFSKDVQNIGCDSSSGNLPGSHHGHRHRQGIDRPGETGARDNDG